MSDVQITEQVLIQHELALVCNKLPDGQYRAELIMVNRMKNRNFNEGTPNATKLVWALGVFSEPINFPSLSKGLRDNIPGKVAKDVKRAIMKTLTHLMEDTAGEPSDG